MLAMVQRIAQAKGNKKRRKTTASSATTEQQKAPDVKLSRVKSEGGQTLGFFGGYDHKNGAASGYCIYCLCALRSPRQPSSQRLPNDHVLLMTTRMQRRSALPPETFSSCSLIFDDLIHKRPGLICFFWGSCLSGRQREGGRERGRERERERERGGGRESGWMRPRQ